jgi:hypothetical protein
MKVTRTSILTGVTRTMDLPITADQISAWAAGALIQNVMPDLTDDQREFFKTGITNEEWEASMGSDDE